MPRYFFDVENGYGSKIHDLAGSLCRGYFDAMSMAAVIAIGVSLDEPSDDPKRRVVVRGRQGRLVGNVPVYSTPSFKNPARNYRRRT